MVHVGMVWDSWLSGRLSLLRFLLGLPRPAIIPSYMPCIQDGWGQVTLENIAFIARVSCGQRPLAVVILGLSLPGLELADLFY